MLSSVFSRWLSGNLQVNLTDYKSYLIFTKDVIVIGLVGIDFRFQSNGPSVATNFPSEGGDQPLETPDNNAQV